MHKLLFRAYNIDGAMNVAWGTQRRERGSTGVETSSRMGVVTRNTAERMRRHGNGIIDLGDGLWDPRRPAVCRCDPGTLDLTIFQVR